MPCFEHGFNGQTYKVAGQPLFKCSTCKVTYHRDKFQAEDFQWKENPKAWKESLEARKLVKNDQAKKRVKEVASV